MLPSTSAQVAITTAQVTHPVDTESDQSQPSVSPRALSQQDYSSADEDASGAASPAPWEQPVEDEAETTESEVKCQSANVFT